MYCIYCGEELKHHEYKNIAHIYDVIVLPSPYARGFAEIELRRYYEYCRLALNSDSLIAELEKLRLYEWYIFCY